MMRLESLWMRAVTLLLVEDDVDDEALMVRVLARRQPALTYHVARNGRDALAYLAQAPSPPQLILLDLQLPRLGGLELLQALRLEPATRLTPVVVFTSSTERTDVVTAYDLGANSYICKPVEFQRFSSVLEQLLNYWVELNQPLPPRTDHLRYLS